MAKKVLKAIFDASETATFDGSSTSIVDLTNDTVKIPSHDFRTGEVVALTGSSFPTGLAAATVYYLIRVSKDKIAFATSLANAQAGTKINLTAVGSHTVTMRKNSFGLVYLGRHIPAGAIVRSVMVDPLTVATSGGNADIQIKAASTALVDDLNFDDSGNDFTAAAPFTVALASSAEAIAVSTKSELTVTVSDAAITAGKFAVYVTYDY